MSSTRELAQEPNDSTNNPLLCESGKEPSTPQQELDAIVEAAVDPHDLPEDIWGAGILLILKDLPDLMAGDVTYESAMRLLLVSVLVALNLFLQMIFLFWILVYVAKPAIKSSQDNYMQYHARVFTDDSEFEEPNWLKFDRQGICSMALSKTGFLFGILFLWVSNCMNEVKSTMREWRIFNQLPLLPAGLRAHDMVAEHGNGRDDIFAENFYLVVCMSRPYKFALLIFIFIPKIIVGLSLIGLGCVWLTATSGFCDLILNSLALSFVVEIDEMLFTCYVPARCAKVLQGTKLALPKKEVKEQSVEERKASERASIKEGYMRSWTYLLGTAILCLGYLEYQPVLPGFVKDVSDHCEHFLHVENSPWCFYGTGNCFPFGERQHND